MEWSLTGLPLPIVLRPPSPLSDEELIAFSRKNRPYRIEKTKTGDITIMTPMGGLGSEWEAFVISELGYWNRDYGSGRVFASNAGFNLADGSTLSPDASWVSEARWQSLSYEEKERFPPLCPEFVVEILSRTDSRKTLRLKMQTWIENGAELAWMIDPYAATLTIYRAGLEPEVLDRPDSVEADGPVSGFRLTTSNLWAEAAR